MGLFAIAIIIWCVYQHIRIIQLLDAIEQLEDTIDQLEKDSHPPIDLTPAMVDVLKSLGVVCTRPPKDWYCTRPREHHGPCAAYPVTPGAEGE